MASYKFPVYYMTTEGCVETTFFRHTAHGDTRPGLHQDKGQTLETSQRNFESIAGLLIGMSLKSTRTTNPAEENGFVQASEIDETLSLTADDGGRSRWQSGQSGAAAAHLAGRGDISIDGMVSRPRRARRFTFRGI